MKRLFPLLVALLLPLPIAASKDISGAAKWNKASQADRNALVQQVMTLNRGTYPPEKMRQCLDDAFAAPAASQAPDFSTAAIVCHAKLQPRK